MATPGVQARLRSDWDMQGLLGTTSILPGRGSLWYRRTSFSKDMVTSYFELGKGYFVSYWDQFIQWVLWARVLPGLFNPKILDNGLRNGDVFELIMKIIIRGKNGYA